VSGLPEASFNDNDHATVAGIASFHDRKYHPWRCRILGHQWPIFSTGPRNGYSPHDTVRCLRGCWGKWYRIGQHRYGSIEERYDQPAPPPGATP
jgi:hypothetical protein